MASAPQFASMVEAWSGPTPELLASDHALDDWLHTHLGTAFHLSGSCPVGSPDDPLSVVDSDLQVHGIEGLHVVDASVLPTPLSRGPAATVMMLGELAAHRFTD